jgi:shikimate kinase
LRQPELSLTAVAISLVGMPGGGKSSVGRQLARRLGRQFFDTDAFVERRVGVPIRTFFEQSGEMRFRQLESEILAELIEEPGCVIATGGGIVLDASNRALLTERTTCVYLRSTPEELFRRLRHDSKRPLLQVADPLGRLRELFEQRDPLYRETAHFVIETGRPSMPTLINMVLMQLELAGVVDPGQVAATIDADRKPIP